MPVILIEAPIGLSEAKKKEMLRQIHAAVEEAYTLGNTMTFLREYPRQNVAIDGVQPTGNSPDATSLHHEINLNSND